MAESHAGRFTQLITVGGHLLAADEPRPIGDDTGPSPYDLLLAALGACTSMTVRMYADRKGWPLTHVDVQMRHSRIHAQDCADCETSSGMVDRIEREIRFDGDLDEDQRRRLLSRGPNKVVMWSYPIIRNGLIYVVDIRNGLYILAYTGRHAADVFRIRFLEGNSNLGDAPRLDEDH